MHQPVVRRTVRSFIAGLIAAAVVALTPAVSSALPIAEFTIGSAAPATGEPVSFTFTGSCDVPPCSVVWTWFQDGGSSLGTRMGVGENITYAFPHAGLFSVVAKITNSTFTHGSATMTHALVVGTKAQETDAAVRLGGWNPVATAAASGGGQHVGVGTANLWFFGSSLDYVARTGPNRGVAQVTIDGNVVATIDEYAPVAGTARRSFTGLAPTMHLVGLTSTGDRAPASTSTGISLDEFVANGTVHVDDTSIWIGYANWAGVRSATADGGTARASTTTGARAKLSFTGTSVTWETATGPDQGIAQVVIDGTTVATVDNYAATAASRVRRTFTVLTGGSHLLQVVVAGRHQAASTSNKVVVDAFVY